MSTAERKGPLIVVSLKLLTFVPKARDIGAFASWD